LPRLDAALALEPPDFLNAVDFFGALFAAGLAALGFDTFAGRAAAFGFDALAALLAATGLFTLAFFRSAGRFAPPVVAGNFAGLFPAALRASILSRA